MARIKPITRSELDHISRGLEMFANMADKSGLQIAKAIEKNKKVAPGERVDLPRIDEDMLHVAAASARGAAILFEALTIAYIAQMQADKGRVE